MIPNMRYFVVSIVSIFLALAIGIYIGFIIDANDMIVEQKEDIVSKLEEKFDYLKEENTNLKKEVEILELENDKYELFSRVAYIEATKNKLSGVNVAIIETNDEYIYSGIGKTLENAGANVRSIITIKDKFLNEELLREVYTKRLGEEKEIGKNVIENAVKELSKATITGEPSEIIDEFKQKDLINIVGDIEEPIDYIIIAGGSESEDLDRINYLDKNIINTCKDFKTPIIGVEKAKVNFSYTSEYKNFRISTVDNVDTVMGKVALIMAMEGRPGYYGEKPSAESLLPDPNNIILE